MARRSITNITVDLPPLITNVLKSIGGELEPLVNTSEISFPR
jgi:hypothetical protein